jgi:hypothetical protein
MPSITQASHYLSPKVEWRTDKVIGTDITLKSTLQLKDWRVKKIKQIYQNAEYLFFNEFENTVCDELGSLDIRIISAAMLRDKEYFYLATPTNFGRYFTISNTVYVIHEVFSRPDYLAHELAHYFYDECGIEFKNDDAEHVKVYKFQDLYKKRYK